MSHSKPQNVKLRNQAHIRPGDFVDVEEFVIPARNNSLFRPFSSFQHSRGDQVFIFDLFGEQASRQGGEGVVRLEIEMLGHLPAGDLPDSHLTRAASLAMIVVYGRWVKMGVAADGLGMGVLELMQSIQQLGRRVGVFLLHLNIIVGL